MKKVMMFLATIAFAVPSPLALSTPAQAKNANVQFCKDYIADPTNPDVNLNRGECISYLTTLDNVSKTGGKNITGFGVHDCDYLLENYPDLFYATYDSKQDCMADYK